MADIVSLLPSLAVPGSAIGAFLIGIIALARLKSTDREALSTGQRQYIEKLEQAREIADSRADKYIAQLDAERQKRVEAEKAQFQAEERAESLQRRIEILEEVLQQYTQRSNLNNSSGDSDNS